MPKKSTTRGDVLKLAIANTTNSGLRLLIPIFLVRLLDQEQFGEYRLFWLIANSLALIVPLGMSRSLLYFLPRSTEDERAAFVSQTVVYLSVMCLPFAIVFAWGPAWLPERIASLTEPGWLLGAFVLLWMVSSLIRILPNADRNVTWQMWAIIGIAITRAVIVLGTAVVTKDLHAIFVALLAFAIFQCVIFGYYVVTRYGFRLRWPSAKGMRRQLNYAVPFGISSMLARARGHIEQWIVAFMFMPGSLAIFTIGAGFNGILHLFRRSVGNVLLPKMSSTHADGDAARSLELNNRGNITICFLTYPIVVFIWLFAAPLVELVYTADYLEAVPLVRIYVVTMVLTSVELATVLLIYEQGKFVAKVSASVLAGAAILSYLGASYFGLLGVAAGGVVGTLVTRILNFRRAAKILEVPFSRLQDWSTLAKILAAAVVSGVLSNYLTYSLVPSATTVVTLAIGALVFGVVFLLLLRIFRIDWIILSLLGRQPWPSRRTA